MPKSNNHKLYFGSRGGMFYRRNGKKVYVNNRFGEINKQFQDDQEMEYQSVFAKVAYYMKYIDPILLIKIFILDLDPTPTDLENIVGPNQQQKTIADTIIQHMKIDENNITTNRFLKYSPEHHTDPHAVPALPKFMVDAMVNLGFTTKGSNITMEPCILIFIIDTLMQRLIEYDTLHVDEICKLKGMSFDEIFGQIEAKQEEDIGYNETIIHTKLRTLLSNIKMNEDLSNIVRNRFGYWKIKQGNLIDEIFRRC